MILYSRAEIPAYINGSDSAEMIDRLKRSLVIDAMNQLIDSRVSFDNETIKIQMYVQFSKNNDMILTAELRTLESVDYDKYPARQVPSYLDGGRFVRLQARGPAWCDTGMMEELL